MLKIINRPDVAVIVLTHNAGELWPQCLAGIAQQNLRAGRYVVMDSSSKDNTVPLAMAAGFEVYSLDAAQFNHGGTRQLATELCAESDYVVFLTQDALLEQADSLQKLLQPFQAPDVAMVYGRHVPHEQASLLEKHARSYTYPAESVQRSRADLDQYGFRAAFSSDVYAAYRLKALRSVGGFPEHIIVSEDSYVSARLLMAGWHTVYKAESEVRHSHQYSLWQTFRRYFDVGVFHAAEAALLQGIGKPDSEAWVYVRSLIRYLYARRPFLLPLAAVQTLVKLFGFRLGKRYQQLPQRLCYRLSLQKAYWLQAPSAINEAAACKRWALTEYKQPAAKQAGQTVAASVAAQSATQSTADKSATSVN